MSDHLYFFIPCIDTTLLIHPTPQTAQFCLVMAGVLLGARWPPRTSGSGRSACSGEGSTSVEGPSSPPAGSSLQLTALLSKRWTWGNGSKRDREGGGGGAHS